MTRLKQQLVEAVAHRHFIPICLLSGLLLRILWIWLVDPGQFSDFKWFEDRAVSIASGDGYSVHGRPTAYWPVGYPGFLGVIFHVFWPSVLLAKLINIALYMGIIALTYLLSKEIFKLESSGRIALSILCFYPNHIAYSSFLATETFFVFLFLLGAILLIRSSGRIALLVFAGLSWGLATLTKPQFVFLPLIFLFVFSKNTKTFVKSATVISLVLLACIVPWMIRNQVLLGKFMLSTNGGIVLMQGNNPYATGKHIWDENIESLLGELHTNNTLPMAAIDDGLTPNMFDSKEVAREARARQIAINYIENHPGRIILMWPKKFFYLYRSDVDGFYYSMGLLPNLQGRMRYVYLGLRIFAELYYFLIIGLACISLRKILPSRVGAYWAGIYVICYFTAVCLVFFGNARYHFPIMPWLAMYAGVGAASLLGLWTESDFSASLKPEAR